MCKHVCVSVHCEHGVYVCIALCVSMHGCEVLINSAGVAFLYVASLFQWEGKCLLWQWKLQAGVWLERVVLSTPGHLPTPVLPIPPPLES